MEGTHKKKQCIGYVYPMPGGGGGALTDNGSINLYVRPLRPPFHALPAVPKHIFFTFFIDQPVPKVRSWNLSFSGFIARSVPQKIPFPSTVLRSQLSTACCMQQSKLVARIVFCFSRNFGTFREKDRAARGVKTRTPGMQLHATIRARNLIHFRRQFSRPPFHVKFQFPRPPAHLERAV